MAIDLAVDYKPYVDELFTKESKKSVLTNQEFDWSGAHSIKIYKVSTASMYDYNRNGENTIGSRYGKIQQLNATTEEFLLKKDRSFTFEMDKLDMDETKGSLQAASALARQLREVVIPEVDTYTYNVMCDNAGIKRTAVELTKTNIYQHIIEANTEMDNADVPESGRVLIVTPSVYLLMKQCKEIVMETNIGNDMVLKGIVSNLDGCAVMKIPANRLPKDFGFMIVHSIATVAPTKLEDYRIHDRPPGINGSLVEGRLCYDAFVLENKAKAICYQPQTIKA